MPGNHCSDCISAECLCVKSSSLGRLRKLLPLWLCPGIGPEVREHRPGDSQGLVCRRVFCASYLVHCNSRGYSGMGWPRLGHVSISSHRGSLATIEVDE